MIRWATVVAKSPQWVDLKLINKPACQGCRGQCHRPLFKLFSVEDNLFRIHKSQSGLALTNSHLLFGDDSNSRLVGQQVGIEIDDSEILSGGFQFYIWPLLIIILFVSIGHYVGVTTQTSPDLLAFMGLVAAMFWILIRYRINNRMTVQSRPKVTFL